MSDDEHESTGDRRYRWRYGPVRLVMPWLAIALGTFQTIRAATGEAGAVFLYLGPALIALGIVAFFVFRWMAKRGI
ncbi:hypothetical protein EDF35_2329 [Rathayibacter sp. PhB151]|uniref:hypothetical protein n=1 Tax=Rathayibacter sp. PhB151 TaxID=2485189 RepID=UPI00106322B8|nr:hypothetical protein [Rathayibacter sp. PhB151]TDX79097.1 hypothetical protein EDF35_2329 [Rathayibacter sp. PhB151]